tara:strand:- start:236 stop:337 length:102 start_codon:yes stop_codon:yes gene_type:complete
MFSGIGLSDCHSIVAEKPSAVPTITSRSLSHSL